MSAAVRWVAWTAVVAAPSTPSAASSPVGVSPWRGAAGRVLGGLLGQVHVQRAALGGLRHDGERFAGHRAHRVHGHPVGADGPLGPGVHVAVAEAQLWALEGGVEAAREVAGVQER